MSLEYSYDLWPVWEPKESGKFGADSITVDLN